MKLQPKTLNSINNLAKLTNITNRATLIANSLELTAEIIKNQIKGGKCIIELKNGKKESINIIGL